VHSNTRVASLTRVLLLLLRLFLVCLGVPITQNEEVQADAEDNLAAGISIAQEEYDADSDSTDSEITLQENWALDDYWLNSDSEEEEEEQDFQNEQYAKPPNIDQIRKEARNLHITILERQHAY